MISKGSSAGRNRLSERRLILTWILVKLLENGGRGEKGQGKGCDAKREFQNRVVGNGREIRQNGKKGDVVTHSIEKRLFIAKKGL